MKTKGGKTFFVHYFLQAADICAVLVHSLMAFCECANMTTYRVDQIIIVC